MGDNMNILMLSNHMNVSGVNTHIIELSKQLVIDGHNVYIVSSGGKYESDIEKLGIPHIILPLNKINNPLILLRTIIKVLLLSRRLNIDIIHCHWRKTSLVAQFVWLFSKIPYVWTNHLDNIPSTFIHRLLSFHRFKTIAVSGKLKEFLVNNLKIEPKDIYIIHNGIDSNNYLPLSTEERTLIRKKFNVTEDDFVISILARLTPVKGHKELISVLAALKKEGYSFKLLIAGEGPREYTEALRNMVRDLKMDDSIFFIGYQNPREVLGISNLFVLSSYNEGFPVACIEALAMKVPVVRTKTAGWEEMKDAILLCNIGDLNELKDCIRKVMNDKELAKTLSNEGFKLFHEKFSSKQMTTKTLDVYKEVISMAKTKNYT